MPLNLYEIAVPTLVRVLQNMGPWLDKAEAHAATRRFDPQVYMTLRLAPDMLPFPRQIQIATDNAKGCVARLAGVPVPAYEDTEANLAELKARLQRTVEFISGLSPEAFAGAEDRPIEIPLRNRDPLRFTGRQYLLDFALPNVYFHATTAYALLRHSGVEVGKSDFLGTFG